MVTDPLACVIQPSRFGRQCTSMSLGGQGDLDAARRRVAGRGTGGQNPVMASTRASAEASAGASSRLRSLLFVPGNRLDRAHKAAASGADALILDLEDAVAIDAKATAREIPATALRELAGHPIPRFLPVNGWGAGWILDDLD